jgi:hypothetical protein
MLKSILNLVESNVDLLAYLVIGKARITQRLNLKALIARSIRRCFESRFRRRLRPIGRVSSHRIEKMRILRINALNALNALK